MYAIQQAKFSLYFMLYPANTPASKLCIPYILKRLLGALFFFFKLLFLFFVQNFQYVHLYEMSYKIFSGIFTKVFFKRVFNGKKKLFDLFDWPRNWKSFGGLGWIFLLFFFLPESGWEKGKRCVSLTYFSEWSWAEFLMEFVSLDRRFFSF